MANILLVGSEPARAKGVRGLLRQDGHRVEWLRSTDLWRAREKDSRPEVIVAAVEDAQEVLTVRGRRSRGFPPPLLLVQGESDFCREAHLDERLVDRITSPFLSEELLARVEALVRVRQVIHREEVTGSPEANIEAPGPPAGLRRVGGRFAALLGSRVPRFAKPLGPYLEVAARLATWADRRDAFEPGHAERVTSVCAMIADGLGVGSEETFALLRAAMLHDIGKVSLPVEVLHQQAPLEESQMRLIRTHPQRGAALLRALDRDDEVASTILYHHEQPDGSGYYGLEGEATPQAARILAVAEVYDAMTSFSVGRRMSSERALDRLSELRGQTVDADCVDALVDRLKPKPRTIPLAKLPY